MIIYVGKTIVSVCREYLFWLASVLNTGMHWKQRCSGFQCIPRFLWWRPFSCCVYFPGWFRIPHSGRARGRPKMEYNYTVQLRSHKYFRKQLATDLALVFAIASRQFGVACFHTEVMELICSRFV